MRRALALLFVTSLLACGGAFDVGGAAGTSGGAAGTSGGAGASGDKCGTVQPCGGAIVGTWKLSRACILDSSFVGGDATEICATATLAVTNVSGTGGISYAADHSYKSTGTITIDTKLTIPTTCFDADHTCDALNQVYATQMQTDPTLKSATCATSGAACVCQVAITEDANEAGTYTTSGTTVSTTPVGDTASDEQYCVQGDELHDIDLEMSMPMGAMGTANIAADIIFTRL